VGECKIVRLGDVANFIRGISFVKDVFSNSSKDQYIGIVTTKSAQSYGIDKNNLRYIPISLIKQDKYLIQNDILISLANSLSLVGRTTFFNKFDAPLSFGAFMGVIRTNITTNTLPKYIFYFLNSNGAKQFFIKNANTTTNISNLNFEILSDLQIPLPPLETQQKIVEELDNIQKGIDCLNEAIDSLKKQLNLDSFRFAHYFGGDV
jgi:type I restriction enzyme S subunit